MVEVDAAGMGAAGPVDEGPRVVVLLVCCFREGVTPRIQPSTKRTSRSGSRPAVANWAAMDLTVEGEMAFMSAK